MFKGVGVLALVAALGAGRCQADAEQEPEAYQGIIELEERVLPFELAGRVVSIDVDEGDEITRGQPLARLDDRLETISLEGHQADLEGAQAQLALLQAGSRPEDVREVSAEVRAARSAESHAERTFTRVKKLADADVANTAEVDEARAAWEQAVAHRQDLQARLARTRHGARPEELEIAAARVRAAEAAVHASRERLRRHVLEADADGTVLTVHLEASELANVGTPVVTVADTRRPYVDVFVPEGRIGEVKLGGRVRVRVDAEDVAFAGVVEHIAQRTEFTPRFLFSDRERPNLVLRVRVRIDDPDQRLHAGVPAFATMQAGEDE